MANEYTIRIDGDQVKELRCKNDDCRFLIGYDNIKVGIFIFVCPKCHHISKFKYGYSEAARDFFYKLKEKYDTKDISKQEGGE